MKNNIIKNYYVRSEREFNYITLSLKEKGYNVFHESSWNYLIERMKFINAWDDGDITWSDDLDKGDVAELYFNFSDYLNAIENE